MGGAPRISIGVPVYNGEAYLGAALDSLLGQTFQDFEIVLSDNCSTDGTEAICRHYAARDHRIRYERADRNRGAAWNFNRVFENSRGAYFKWASSNDLHAPSCLSRSVEILDSIPDVVLAYPKTRIIDGAGGLVKDFEDNLHLPWADPGRRFHEFLRRVRLCNLVFGLMRSDVLRRTALLGKYPGSDVVLLAELTLHGSFYEIPEFLFYRRLYHVNFDRNRSVENWQEFFDPNSRGKIFMRTWRHQYQYLSAILRSSLSTVEKARIASSICRGYITHRNLLAQELVEAASKAAVRSVRRRSVS